MTEQTEFVDPVRPEPAPKKNTAREYGLAEMVRAKEGPPPTRRTAYRFGRNVKTEPVTRPGQRYPWS